MDTTLCDQVDLWRSCPTPAVPPRRADRSVMHPRAFERESFDDNALVAAARGRDDAAFGELVRRYKTRVFGLTSRFARNAHELEDLCQEIFIQAYRKLDGFRGESPFEHWLTRIAIRKCYDLLRRTRRERTVNISLESAHDFVEDASARRDAQVREAREVLQRAMAMLSPDERLVLTLLELEDQPVREIAAATGWSEANVRTRACRARAALKEILQRTPSRRPV